MRLLGGKIDEADRFSGHSCLARFRINGRAGQPARGAFRIVLYPVKSKHTHFHADTLCVGGQVPIATAPGPAQDDDRRLLAYIAEMQGNCFLPDFEIRYDDRQRAIFDET
jgi:hypothetical protein